MDYTTNPFSTFYPSQPYPQHFPLQLLSMQKYLCKVQHTSKKRTKYIFSHGDNIKSIKLIGIPFKLKEYWNGKRMDGDWLVMIHICLLLMAQDRSLLLINSLVSFSLKLFKTRMVNQSIALTSFNLLYKTTNNISMQISICNEEYLKLIIQLPKLFNSLIYSKLYKTKKDLNMMRYWMV